MKTDDAAGARNAKKDNKIKRLDKAIRDVASMMLILTSLEKDLVGLRETMKKGGGEKPIWMTEFGTCGAL